MRKRLIALPLLLLVLAACASSDDTTVSPSPDGAAQDASGENILTLATSPVVASSGLLDTILPEFEAQANVSVNVIAAETAEALQQGVDGDVDVFLLPPSTRVDDFITAGAGSGRADVMLSEFVIVGPSSDLAGINGRDNASLAFTMIADAGVTFVSTGGETATHLKEQLIWDEAGIDPEGQFWYQNTGQDINAVLSIAAEEGAYTLVERAIFYMSNGTDLEILVEGDVSLQSAYSVIQNNADDEQAQAFADWLLSVEIQDQIAEFMIDGEQVFVPNSEAYRTAQDE